VRSWLRLLLASACCLASIGTGKPWTRSCPVATGKAGPRPGSGPPAEDRSDLPWRSARRFRHGVDGLPARDVLRDGAFQWSVAAWTARSRPAVARCRSHSAPAMRCTGADPALPCWCREHAMGYVLAVVRSRHRHRCPTRGRSGGAIRAALAAAERRRRLQWPPLVRLDADRPRRVVTATMTATAAPTRCWPAAPSLATSARPAFRFCPKTGAVRCPTHPRATDPVEVGSGGPRALPAAMPRKAAVTCANASWCIRSPGSADCPHVPWLYPSQWLARVLAFALNGLPPALALHQARDLDARRSPW
jgi:hypothetical protein